MRITAGAVVLSDPPGVAHERCARESAGAENDPRSALFEQRRSSLAGWLLVVHALCVLGLLWAIGADRFGLGVVLTFLAGLAIFVAWELDS